VSYLDSVRSSGSCLLHAWVKLNRVQQIADCVKQVQLRCNSASLSVFTSMVSKFMSHLF
jgi:hypothetical protein